MNGSIIQLQKEDIPEIIALWKRAGLPYKPRGRDTLENLQRQITLDFVSFLGMKSNGKLIGTILVNHEGRKGWLNRIAVDPQFQRREIALKLIEAAEKWLDERGIEIYTVLVETWNKKSMALFERADYKLHSDIVYFSKRKSEIV